MQDCMLAFAFDDLNRVALIRKNWPSWQAGQWNGVGGKVEAKEPIAEAMKREFCEKPEFRSESMPGRIEV